MDITPYLTKAGWDTKKAIYAEVLDSVEFKTKVKAPVISIVMISWLYNDKILRNITELQKQRTTNFELIFVNNGKGDTEFAAILPFVDTYVKLNRNTGAYKARNIGSLFAQAPVIIFLEDDGIVGEGFVNGHLEAYNSFEIISVRGVCRPISENELNKMAKHYYLGNRPFPRFVDLEGNASYKAEAFFAVGGWNDAIEFGHGGPDLSIRLSKKYPDKRMQIYSPVPVIYHDYVKDTGHLKTKYLKQKKSLEMLKARYPDWGSYFKNFRTYKGKTHLLLYKDKTKQSYWQEYGAYLSEKIADESRAFLNATIGRATNFINRRFFKAKS